MRFDGVFGDDFSKGQGWSDRREAGLDGAVEAVAQVAWSAAAACDPQAGTLGPSGLAVGQVETLVDAACTAAERSSVVALLAAVEAERRGLPGLDGRAGLRAWLARRFSLPGPDAARLARQARFIGRHPGVGVALAAGRLRMGHLVVIVSTVASDLEDLFDECWPWLEGTAADLDVDRFATVMRTWRLHADQDRPPPDPATRSNVRLWAGPDGLGHFDGTLDPEGWELLIEALEKHDRPDPVDGLLAPRTRGQRLAEQLVNIARFYLTHHQPSDGDAPDRAPAFPAPDGPAATVNVFADLGALDPEFVDALPLETRLKLRCELERFGPVSPATAQRLACDSYLARVLVRGRSVVLDLGFRTATFTEAQRRAILAEFSECPCGCGTPAAWCDIHHLVPHDPEHERGPTDLHNGVPLCRRAHTLTHERGLTIRKIAPGKVVFVPPE